VAEYLCSLEIVGLQGAFHAKGRGKKSSSAEKDACLEACYKLERLGILYSTDVGESYRQRNKRLVELVGDNEEDDYLDLTASNPLLIKQRNQKCKTA
jgi:hypothetical protein